MNYKLEYLTKLFQKTSKKGIENYCLSRLWHRLNDDTIKIIPQQYVNRHVDKYALTDVFFPQVKIHVEVNEPAHYESKERIEEDKRRKIDIERKTGHQVFTIDCRKEVNEIHKQIDDIILKIQSAIKIEKGKNTFKPWNPDEERNPIFWKGKRISIKDEVSLNNIEDICHLFNADFKKTKRGYLSRGGINHPTLDNLHIWWPSAFTRSGWLNTINSDETEIIESNKDINTRKNHFKEYQNSSQKRCAFFHYKDVLGITSYKFKGIFSVDKNKSNSKDGIVWKRTSDYIDT